MGCCAGLRHDILLDKDIIVNIDPNEKRDLIEGSIELSKDKDKISKKSDSIKQGKNSSKTIETNNTDDISQLKSPKKFKNICYKKIKFTAKNLKQITICELENIHKFFDVK